MKKSSDASRAGHDADESTTIEVTQDSVAAAARMHIWQFQAVRDALFVAAVIAVIWLGYALRAVTVPLLVALLLAYLFEPLIVKLSRRPHVSRARAVGGLLALIVAVFLVILAIVVPLVYVQTTQFVREIRDGSLRDKVSVIGDWVPQGRYREEFDKLLNLLPGKDDNTALDLIIPTETTAIRDSVPSGETGPSLAGRPVLTEEDMRAIAEDVYESRQRNKDGEFFGFASSGINAILSFVGTIVQIGLLLFLIPFYFFFFSLWYPDVVAFGRRMLPEKNRKRTLELIAKMDRVVSGFVRGRIIISMIMGVLLAIGWWMCGVPYAIPLGLVIGVFCAVPYLGGIGIPVAIGLLFFERAGAADKGDLWWLWVLLWPSVVFFVVQMIEGYVLTPMIAGKATNLDPVTIIVAVLAGGSVLGVYGMLLAIPVAACLKILCTEIVLPRIRAWTKGEAADPLPISRG